MAPSELIESGEVSRLQSPSGQRTWRCWIAKSVWSVGDQALVSGGNFALNICYARWLAPEGYGIFAIFLAVFLLLAAIHNAFVLEPMIVLGPARGEMARPGYLANLVVLHGVVAAIPLGLLIAVLPLVPGGRHFNRAEVILSASAVPLILLFWMLRRKCYLSANPKRAFGASLVYTASLVAVLVGTRSVASPATGFLTMAAASLASSVVLLAREEWSWHPANLARLARLHWDYGKWVLGAGLLYWLNTSFFVPLLGVYLGVVGAAVLRAADNFVLPFVQVMAAMSLLITPWISGQASRMSPAWLSRTTRRLSLAVGGVALLYGVVVVVGSGFVLPRIYPSSAYNSVGMILPVLCAAAGVRAAADLGAGISLRAIGSLDVVLWANLAGAAASVSAGLFLVAYGGVMGAAWAMLLASLVQFLVSQRSLAHQVRQTRTRYS
jgi:O-antigen/teichoic acid export membrane protein